MNRLRGAFGLGLGVTGAALAFGSRPLAVAGVGLLLAAGAAWLWAGLAHGPVSVVHAASPAPATEGDHVRVRIEVERRSRIPVGSVAVAGRLGRLGSYECRLRGRDQRFVGELDLGRLPRGRFPVTDARVELGDHLGLESVSSAVASTGTAVVVHPRLVEVSSLFGDAGRHGGDGRALLLRRPAGFDFHSVRDHEQGESLRRVHWPTTARRGQLMVKELEEPPRDAAVVLLDCDPGGATGSPPDSSFDEAVRAAGSVLKVYAVRARTAILVTTGREAAVAQVSSLGNDFRVALDVLAAAEPDALHGLARSLGRGSTSVARASELVVVTATLGRSTVDALLGTAQGRLVSVVWIDAASYAGRPSSIVPDLLRLSTAGIAVTAVRRGDDLAAALDSPRSKALAHG